jgi:hypothetical protein
VPRAPSARRRCAVLGLLDDQDGVETPIDLVPVEVEVVPTARVGEGLAGLANRGRGSLVYPIALEPLPTDNELDAERVGACGDCSVSCSGGSLDQRRLATR